VFVILSMPSSGNVGYCRFGVVFFFAFMSFADMGLVAGALAGALTDVVVSSSDDEAGQSSLSSLLLSSLPLVFFIRLFKASSKVVLFDLPVAGVGPPAVGTTDVPARILLSP